MYLSINESKIKWDRNLTQSHTSTKMKSNSYLSLCQNKYKAHARTQAQEFSVSHQQVQVAIATFAPLSPPSH